PLLLTQHVAHLPLDAGIVEINVSNLMIGHGKRAARTAVEQFQSQLLPDGYPTMLAQHSIEVNGGIDRGDAVLRDNHHSHGALAKKRHKCTDNGIDDPHVVPDGRMERTEALQIVIKMREVNET